MATILQPPVTIIQLTHPMTPELVRESLQSLETIQGRYTLWTDPLSCELRNWYKGIQNAMRIHERNGTINALAKEIIEEVDTLRRTILVNRFDNTLLVNPVLDGIYTWEESEGEYTLNDFMLCCLTCARSEENPFTEEEQRAFYADPIREGAQVRSPFHGELIRRVNHEFAKAMLDLLQTLPFPPLRAGERQELMRIKTFLEARRKLESYCEKIPNARTLEEAIILRRDLEVLQQRMMGAMVLMTRVEREAALRTEQGFARAEVRIRAVEAQATAQVAATDATHRAEVGALTGRLDMQDQRFTAEEAAHADTRRRLNIVAARADSQEQTIRHLTSALNSTDKGGGGGCSIL